MSAIATLMVGDLATLDTDPEWWKRQLEKISDGVPLEDLAKEYCIYYGVYRNWIRGSVEREKEYQQALLDKRTRTVEKVTKKVVDTALANPIDLPRYPDVLRAAEIVLNTKESGGSGGTPSINIVIGFVEAKDGKVVNP